MARTTQQHTYDYFIDGHGKWSCEGNPIEDPDLFRILSRSLFVEDGLFFIRCEGEIHPVRVADAPLWVRYVHVTPGADGNPQTVELELQDGRREPLDPTTLTVSNSDALYCLATHRRLKARFDKVAYYEFTRFLHMDGDDDPVFYFLIAGRRYEVGR